MRIMNTSKSSKSRMTVKFTFTRGLSHGISSNSRKSILLGKYVHHQMRRKAKKVHNHLSNPMNLWAMTPMKYREDLSARMLINLRINKYMMSVRRESKWGQ